MLLAKSGCACVCRDKRQNWKARLAHVCSETNSGIGETLLLLHSRLSLLSIDIDCDRRGEQFPCVLYTECPSTKKYSF